MKYYREASEATMTMIIVYTLLKLDKVPLNMYMSGNCKVIHQLLPIVVLTLMDTTRYDKNVHI